MIVRFGPLVLWAFVLGCAGQARQLETEDSRDPQLDAPEGGDTAFIVIPNDREFDQVAQITGGSHDPKEMPAGNIGTPEAPPPKAPQATEVRIKRCGIDADCPTPRVCLRPTGGPHPFGICGAAVDNLGRPTSGRTVRSCSAQVACPAGGRCALAYGTYGVCLSGG